VACSFTDIAHLSAAQRGGKGFSLAELARLGLPVPPGFTVTTTAGRAALQTHQVPHRFFGQLEREMARLEQATGRGFGSTCRPLLVSVRSGAEHSMPGMMDTVLNLGLNPETVRALAKETGDEWFAWDCYRRFLVSCGAVVYKISAERLKRLQRKNNIRPDKRPRLRDLRICCEAYRQELQQIIEEGGADGLDLDDVYVQLVLAMHAVFASWRSERAQAYREAHNIPDWLGTAANVQAMVFGNRDRESATGVVFSRNVATGERELYGEWLPNAQGEDVVSGTNTPRPIADLATWNRTVYRELGQICERLEHHFGDVVDVEFTVESGSLYILQVRPAKRTTIAAISHAVQMVWERRIDKEQALARVPLSDTQWAELSRSAFDANDVACALGQHLLAQGIPASPGAVYGRVALSSEEACYLRSELPGDSIVLFRPQTTPDDFSGMLAADAIVTAIGGATSHAAVVARSLGKVAVVGVGQELGWRLLPRQLLSVDGTRGLVFDSLALLRLCVGKDKKETQIFLRWCSSAVNDTQAAQLRPRVALERRSESISVAKLAADFYLSEAMAAAAEKNSTFGVTVRALRSEVHQGAAELIATYIVLATAGELRHMHEVKCCTGSISDINAKMAELQKFGVAKTAFLSRKEVQEDVATNLEEQPLEVQIAYLEAAQRTFSELLWNLSYGGRKWADICQAALLWLRGEMPATVFVDRAFDLQHNSGRMFGKTEYFLHSSENLSLILDSKFTHSGVRDLYRVISSIFLRSSPECCSPQVKDMYDQGVTANLW
jgi:phosphoenolpyruvate synthase/pyruvate phosphate dikinase